MAKCRTCPECGVKISLTERYCTEHAKQAAARAREWSKMDSSRKREPQEKPRARVCGDPGCKRKAITGTDYCARHKNPCTTPGCAGRTNVLLCATCRDREADKLTVRYQKNQRIVRSARV